MQTCKSNRKFRRKRLTTKKSTRTPRRRNAAAEWDEKMAANSNKVELNYSPQETFPVGDVINHVKFGMGIVEAMHGDKKALVLFREGEKILVHGLK